MRLVLRLSTIITLVGICFGLFVAGTFVDKALGADCGRNVRCLHRALDWQRRDRAHLRHELAVKRQPLDLHAAIHLSAILFDVSERAMTCIATAESGYGRQTTSEAGSGALGPFQWLASSWSTTPLGRAGYSRLNPLAASLSTAQRVVEDGMSWREWVTGAGCGL